MNSTQLAIILTKDNYTRAVFQGVYPSDKLPKLQGFRPSQPCLLPTWILVRSLDHTGLRFISQKNEKENFSTLMDYPKAIILGNFLLF